MVKNQTHHTLAQ